MHDAANKACICKDSVNRWIGAFVYLPASCCWLNLLSLFDLFICLLVVVIVFVDVVERVINNPENH